MKKLVKKYEQKLCDAGLANFHGSFRPILGGLDNVLVWNREAEEIPLLEPIFKKIAINSLVCLFPAPPYDRIIHFLARRALEGDGVIRPRDCETRTFLHDLPVIERISPELAAQSLKKRKVVIAVSGDSKQGFTPPAVIAQGTVSPEQGFVSVSSVCFACFVKFFTDYLEALQTRTLSKEMEELFESLAPGLDTEPPPVPHLIKGPFSDPDQVYSAMTQAGQELVSYGLVDSYFGNISYCLDRVLFISQTGSSLDELTGCIDPVPLDGSSSAGLTASSELTAHMETLLRTGARAVLHGHPKFSVIMSMDCDPEKKAKCPDRKRCHIQCPEKRFIRSIPVVPGEVGTGPTGLCNTLPRAFEASDNVIVYGHGIFSLGRQDFIQAFSNLLQVETLCRELYFKKIETLKKGLKHWH
ncbi:class II aldolase/adducin family protein [Desulfospira joergensenii]|uniref:class II aldolase/adducin family protein n=1 Tax=Desulfospira joergensenii TaxID=53329 RepID=UPI0003B2FFC2|nr:class II aldolase/adducin family protein [Desulfospira joergensenii]